MADPISIPESFTDPVIYDANEQELVDRVLADAQTKLPEWNPLEGNTEVVLTEALALLVAELVYSINRLPGRTLEGLLVLYGLARDAGAPPQGTARFTIADSLGFTIPLGTQLRAYLDDTDEELDFATTVAMTVDPGDTSVDVPIAALTSGISGNGLAAGTTLEVLDAVPYVESALTVGVVTGGRDVETDMDYYNRGSALLSRLTSTLVLPAQFRAAALEDPAVGNATVYDLYDPDGVGVPGDDPGHVTVSVIDDEGLALSSPQMDAIQGILAGRAHAGLDVHVVAPDYQDVNVTTTVVAALGHDHADVHDAVVAALEEYLSPKNWTSGGTTVYHNELISLIDRVPGVERVASLTVPVADAVLTGVIVLPEPGAIAVTVS